VKRLLVLAALGCALAALGPGEARATNECRGLLVCVPVAGPWVVVPAQTRRVEYQLRCPRGYVVGGLDAELSSRAIDITFVGFTGSPVNPGVTTSREAVFLALYTGAARRVTTFRPHIGCLPAQGGGGGAPPAYRRLAAVFPPGRPAIRRVKTITVAAGAVRRAVHACGRDERLLAASHALGFYQQRPPVDALIAGVSVNRTVRAGRIRVAVSATDAVFGARAIVQVSAICAGGSP
jgi:hypothetical protein